MSDDLYPPHLQQLLERRSQLQELLARLQQELDFTTDPKEQMRLEREIDKAKTTLTQAGSDICLQGLSEVRKRRSKQAYAAAIRLLHHLLTEYPSDLEFQGELSLLETLEQQNTRIQPFITGLSRIQDESFKAIRKQVIAALRQADDSSRYGDLVEQVEWLIKENITQGDFLFWWEEVFSSSDHDTDFADTEKQGVAERIRTGSIVLFLGSGVIGGMAQEAELGKWLAKQAEYDASAGSLSSVAEYYRMKFDLGVAKLLTRLDGILPDNVQQATFYQKLARIPARLVLVSAAYDDLLEQTFLQTGKPFVRLTSIIQEGKPGIGHVLVSFSDDNPDAGVYPKEEISGLQLENYSVIYKIRGTCRARNGADVRLDALALTESDYFSFARHADSIIPDYLATQFLNKGFLFVGYRPRHWEDRLLASALLKKRGFAGEPCRCLTVAEAEPLEGVFWQSSNVMPYAMDVQELERYLEGGMV